MKKLITVSIVVYVLIAIVTFGHAWRVNERYAKGTYIEKDGGFITMGATLCAVVWPLYWSQQLWKNEQ